MKLTRHNGRAGKNGAYNPKHNDRRFDIENSEHIDMERARQNIYWDCYTGFSSALTREKDKENDYSFEKIEQLYYFGPYIKEKMDLDIQVSKLKLMKANHTSQKYRLEDNIAKHYPQQIAILKERISGMTADIQTAKANFPADKEQFFMKVGDKAYTDKKEAGPHLWRCAGR